MLTSNHYIAISSLNVLVTKNIILMRKFLLLAVIACCTWFCTNAQSKEGIKVTDMLQIKSIGSVWITDDGSKAAFSILNIEPDTAKWEYKYVTQIWTVNTDGSHLRQLTF